MRFSVIRIIIVIMIVIVGVICLGRVLMLVVFVVAADALYDFDDGISIGLLY